MTQSGHESKPTEPVTHNKPVAGAAQTCPLLALKECDVAELKIDVEIEGEYAGTKTLTAKRVMRRDPLPPRVKSQSIKDLLGRYDIVIDAIAGYPCLEELVPRHHIKIGAEAEWEGTCQNFAHPVLRLKPINYGAPGWAERYAKKVGGKTPEFAREFVTKKATVQLANLKTGIQLKRDEIVVFTPGAHKLEIPAKHDYVSNPIGSDFAEGAGRIGIIIDIIRSLWPTLTPAIIEIGAKSCGKRKHGARPNGNLIGCVRIFRRDEITLGFKIPPLGSFKHEGEGKVNPFTKEEWEVIHKNEASLGLLHGKTETTQKGDESTSSGAVWVGKEGKHERPAGGSRLNRIHAELDKYEIGVVLRRNGREIDFLAESEPLDKSAHPSLASAQHTGGQLAGKIQHKNIRDVVIFGLAQGVKTVAAIFDFIHKMPQMGWKFEVSISLFVGEITAEWGWQYLNEPVVPGRYLGTDLMVDLSFNMNLVSLDARLSFGIEFKRLGTGISIKAVGSLKLDIPVSFTVRLSLKQKPEGSILVRPSGRVAVDVIGDASLLGHSVGKIRGGIGIGFAMDDGELRVGVHTGVHLLGTLLQTPLEVTYFVQGPGADPPKEPHVKQLWPSHVIHKFA